MPWFSPMGVFRKCPLLFCNPSSCPLVRPSLVPLPVFVLHFLSLHAEPWCVPPVFNRPCLSCASQRAADWRSLGAESKFAAVDCLRNLLWTKFKSSSAFIATVRDYVSPLQPAALTQTTVVPNHVQARQLEVWLIKLNLSDVWWKHGGRWVRVHEGQLTYAFCRILTSRTSLN